MRLFLIGAAILGAAVILVVCYCCLVVASRADEEMERNHAALERECAARHERNNG